MIKYSVEHGHADFYFKVIGPNGLSFHVVDRYSSMRSFQSLVRKDLDDSVKLNSLPQFPKKRYMGGLDEKFLDQRMKQLDLFFNAFLSINAIARNDLVLTYFGTRVTDQQSHDKLIELSKLIEIAKEGDGDTKKENKKDLQSYDIGNTKAPDVEENKIEDDFLRQQNFEVVTKTEN